MNVRKSGFTLMELTIVLAIMAVAAAAVALKFRVPLAQARAKNLVEQIAAFDQLTRTAAREQDKPLRMLFDANVGRISRTDEDGQAVGSGLELPQRCRLERLLLPDTASGANAVVTCSRRGLTPSYGLVLRKDNVQAQCLLVAGLSGQMTEMASEKELQDNLAILQGDDAR